MKRKQEPRRECCDPECGWSGLAGNCVHPKHDASVLLCPVCGEVTQFVNEDLRANPK